MHSRNQITAAEDRRKNPPRKVVNILYKKERQYNTASRRPKLLTDLTGSRVVSQDRYSVCFEETIVLESSNLQLTDEGNLILQLNAWFTLHTNSNLLHSLCIIKLWYNSGTARQLSLDQEAHQNFQVLAHWLSVICIQWYCIITENI
jgi:hypothetical protein